MTCSSMTNEQFLMEIQSIQKEIIQLSSQSYESFEKLQQTKMKLKLLKKSITKDGDEKTRKLVYKAYAKKLKRLEKELGLKKSNRVLNDLQEYTVSQHEMQVQEMEEVPSVVPSLSVDTEESMEDTTSCKNLLEQENETNDYECFNICQIS